MAGDPVTFAQIKTARNLGNAAAGDVLLAERVPGQTGAVTLATTGSGNYVRATSPTLVTPILGLPTSGNLGNCTNLPVHSVTVSDGTSAAAAGDLGQIISASTAGTAFSSGVVITPTSITVTPGIWAVTVAMRAVADSGGSIIRMVACASTTSGALDTGGRMYYSIAMPATTIVNSTTVGTRYYRFTTDTIVYCAAQVSVSGSPTTGILDGYVFALRIG